MITIEEIKTLRLEPKALFQGIRISNFEDAIGSIQLHELDRMLGTKGYTLDFVSAMVNEICNSFQRKMPMMAEDQRALATMILDDREYQKLTILDCRLFANMVISGKINSSNNSIPEYDLMEVTKSSILKKLRCYYAKRNEILINKEIVSSKKEEDEKVNRRPLDDWMLTHDYAGNDMPPEWDPYKYWYSKPSNKELNEVIFPSIEKKVASFLGKTKN